MKTAKDILQGFANKQKEVHMTYDVVLQAMEIYANQSKWISVEGAEIEEGEYLTYNKLTDVTEVNYFDGQYWGYLASDRKEVTHYQAKPTAP